MKRLAVTIMLYSLDRLYKGVQYIKQTLHPM